MRDREEGPGKKSASGNLPEAVKGEAADKAAKATGRARRTVEKAEVVVAAAEQNPETFAPMQAEMDRTGTVDGVFKRVKALQERAAYEERAIL
jgi:hypothetical protein